MVFWSRICRETAEKLFWTINVIRDICLFSDLVNLEVSTLLTCIKSCLLVFSYQFYIF